MTLGKEISDSILDLDLHYGNQFIQSHINLREKIASWDIKLDDLGMMSHQLSGSLQSKGHMVSDSSQSTLTLQNFAFQSVHLNRLNLDMSGQPEAHKMHLQVQQFNDVLELTSSGAYTNNELSETIQTLQWTKNRNQIAVLKQPSILKYTRDGITLTPLCAGSDDFGSLCGELTQKASTE